MRAPEISLDEEEDEKDGGAGQSLHINCAHIAELVVASERERKKEINDDQQS